MFKFDLQENEKVADIVRQTEAVLIKPALLVLVVIYLPWYFLIKYDLQYDYRRLLLAWTFLALLYAINKYLLWLLNVYILTDKRIIHVHYFTLFKKRVEESPIENIIGISFATTGLFSSLFDYGNVEMRLANSPQPLVLAKVRQPAAVKDIIWKNRQKPAASSASLPDKPAKAAASSQVQAKIRKIV